MTNKEGHNFLMTLIFHHVGTPLGKIVLKEMFKTGKSPVEVLMDLCKEDHGGKCPHEKYFTFTKDL